MAAVKIEQFNRPDAEEIGAEFCLIWLVFLTMNPDDTTKPSFDAVSARFEEKYYSYKSLFENIFTNKDPDKNPEVQLAWELFTNCTDKAAPANFLKLMTATGVLNEVIAAILVTVKEPT